MRMKLPLPSRIKKPAGVLALRRVRRGHTYDPCSFSMTTAAAKIKMKARQADVAPAAVMAGAMSRIRNVMPIAAVTSVAAMTWRVVAGAVTWHMVPASVAGAMTGTVSAAMARSVTGTMAAAMAGRVAISRLHSGRSEEGEAGSDGQEGGEFFHSELSWGLSLCREGAAHQSDAKLTHPFKPLTDFFTLSRRLPESLSFRAFWKWFPTAHTHSSTQHTHGLAN